MAVASATCCSAESSRTSETAPAPDAERAAAQASIYDRPALRDRFVSAAPGGLEETTLLIEGVRCAGCFPTIQRRLERIDGVAETAADQAAHRVRVRFSGDRVQVRDLLSALEEAGYHGMPYHPSVEEEMLETERRQRLRELGIAALLGMQVMMISLALYLGDWFGMVPAYRQAFHWLAALLATPVLLFSARPYFTGAFNALRTRTPTMDVPVALGLAIAYAGSLAAIANAEGDVYFDSIVMFVLLLHTARYVELIARRRGTHSVRRLAHSGPSIAHRLTGDGGDRVETVPALELRAGDAVLVRPGEVVPADGEIVSGTSSVDSAMLTGEAEAHPVRPGDAVLAGATNHEQPLVVRVTAVAEGTVLATLLELARRAAADRPPLIALADRAAGAFIGAVVLLAIAVAGYWWFADPDRWLPITVAVLVVTCPCALSLAAPAAMTAALEALASRGLAVSRGDALERLAKITHLVMDKTGTLTTGAPTVIGVRPLGDLDGTSCLEIAAALERNATHPLADAIVGASEGAGPLRIAADVEAVPGAGLRGMVGGRRYAIGTRALIESFCGTPPEDPADDEHTRVWLADPHSILCELTVEDALRGDAQASVRALADLGVTVSICSGDRPERVRAIAAELGIEKWAGAQSPLDKIRFLERVRGRGDDVAMVGDGINDAPVLAAANVSLALGAGASAAKSTADLIVVGNELGAIAEAIRIGRRYRRILGQNLLWAVAYNLIALPAAAIGLVPPWLAAVGMSASSLIVVTNAARLLPGFLGRRG